MNKRSGTWLGWSITIFWASSFYYLSFFSDRLKPNEWGDWAAGLSAPIAFVWLILGYYQQGRELRANVQALELQEKALQLQVQELKESVEQQTAIAKAALKQAEIAEESQVVALRSQIANHQPIFSQFSPRDYSKDMLRVAIMNVGAPCYNATIQVGPESSHLASVEAVRDRGAWIKTSQLSFTFLFVESRRPNSLSFVIHYQDELAIDQAQSFKLEFDDWPPAQGKYSIHFTRDHVTFNSRRQAIPVTL